MREVILLVLIVAAGFTASGVISSFYMLVSGQREYAPKADTDAGRLAAVGLTIFTGPSVLAINALRRPDEGQGNGYRRLILLLVMLWSYVIGLLVVNVALTIPSPF